MTTSPTVFLIGAGPGDPGLITVRGLECLQRADVVLHDHLVSTRLLRRARPGAEIIDVGTASPQPLAQEAITRTSAPDMAAIAIRVRLLALRVMTSPSHASGDPLGSPCRRTTTTGVGSIVL